MSQKIKEYLLELGVAEDGVDEFLNGVEVRNRQIEEEQMIVRNNEAETETEAEETDTEAEDSEANEETEEESNQVVIDEQSLEGLFGALAPSIQGLVDQTIADVLQAQRTIIEDQNKKIRSLESLVGDLGKKDVEKVRKAIEDMPDERKSRFIFRPSQQVMRDVETGEEEDGVVTSELVKSQHEKMMARRRGEEV